MKLLHVSPEDQKKIQYAGVQILEEFDRVCEENNLKYSLAYGTLIGTIRHKGFIPWDDDIDVFMPREDFNKLREVYKSKFKPTFFYQTNKTDPEYFYLLDKVRLNNSIFRESFVSKYNIHHGIYIDIFPLDFIPKQKVMRRLHFLAVNFYRTGVMAKYPMLRARTGKKKWVFMALRLFYAVFPLKFLYERAQTVAQKYNNVEDKTRFDVVSFFGPYKMREIHDASVFDKIIKGQFMGHKFNVIAEYDSYLKRVYGDYMKLPPEEKRSTRHTITELKINMED